MFWKRARSRTPQVQQVAQVFGEVHAQQFEAVEHLAGNSALVVIYQLTMRIVGQTVTYGPETVRLLQQELNALIRQTEEEQIHALAGYSALSSLINRVSTALPGTATHAILPALKAVHGGMPLWRCTPLDEWSDFTGTLKIDVSTLLFTWDQLCFLYLLTLGALLTGTTQLKQEQGELPLLEPKMFRMLLLQNVALWRDGTLAQVEQARPEDARVAYLTAAQIIYERYRQGAAINFHFDLARASLGELFPDTGRGLTAVMTARGLKDELPAGLSGQPEGPVSAQMSGLITGTTYVIDRVSQLLRDQIDHRERLAYMAGHDPIVSLCQV